MQNLTLDNSKVELIDVELAHLERAGITPERADALLTKAMGASQGQFSAMTLTIVALDRIEKLEARLAAMLHKA